MIAGVGTCFGRAAGPARGRRSCLESPEKAAPHVEVPAGEERLEVAELPVFEIRAEREAWDALAHRRFLQSTRR